jgi:hypothetical protein
MSGGNSDELIEKYKANGRAGAVGEDRFASGLARAFGDRYLVHRSLRIPTNSAVQTRLNGDVDFAIINGNRMVLVDVKLWKSGTYRSLLGHLPTRNWTPYKNDKDEWRLSRNMGSALERWREALPHMRVTALVEFEPADGKDAVPDVSGLAWPGAHLKPAGRIVQLLPRSVNPFLHGVIWSYQAGAAYDRIETRLGKTSLPISAATSSMLEAHLRNPASKKGV